MLAVHSPQALTSSSFHTLDQFDFAYECSCCHFRGVATVTGFGTASNFAYEDAMMSLACVPCPTCHRHDPRTIACVQEAEARRFRAERMKVLLPVLFIFFGLVGGAFVGGLTMSAACFFAVLLIAAFGAFLSFLANAQPVAVPQLDTKIPSHVKFRATPRYHFAPPAYARAS